MLLTGSGACTRVTAQHMSSTPQDMCFVCRMQGPGLACLERLLSGRQCDWPASCEEPLGGAAEAVRAGVAPGSSGMGSGDLGDAADAVGDPRHGEGPEGALKAGAGLSNEDDEGRLWLVGDRISIADIVVADLVSV